MKRSSNTDYYPEKTWNFISKEDQDKLLIEGKKTREDVLFHSDNYLKFIVEELKPYIDENYSVYKNGDAEMVKAIKEMEAKIVQLKKVKKSAKKEVEKADKKLKSSIKKMAIAQSFKFSFVTDEKSQKCCPFWTQNLSNFSH